VQSLRTNTGSTQSSRAASLSSVSSIGSPVAGAGNPYALFALRPEPKTLARFSTGEPVFMIRPADHPRSMLLQWSASSQVATR
jgi:hypothetical protein